MRRFILSIILVLLWSFITIGENILVVQPGLPIITNNVEGDTTIKLGDSISFQGQVLQNNYCNTITYSCIKVNWYLNEFDMYNATNNLLANGVCEYTFKPDSAGEYLIMMMAACTEVSGIDYIYTINVDSCLVTVVKNVPPNITTKDTIIEMDLGTELSFSINAEDQNDNTLEYTSSNYDSISNIGNTFNITPKFEGVDTVYLIVSDGKESDSIRVILDVKAVTSGFYQPMVEDMKFGAKNYSNKILVYDLSGRILGKIKNMSDWKNSGMYIFKIPNCGYKQLMIR